jgi:selenocysteine lyase/cysteine desulfurase
MEYKNINWNRIKEQFTIEPSLKYFGSCVSSPIPTQVIDAANQYYIEQARFGDSAWDIWEKRQEAIRSNIATLLNAEPEEIGFGMNTSHGMNLVAEILKGEGNVLTMKGEFASSIVPWLNKRYEVSYVNPINFEYPISEIESAFKASSNTKVLVSSHVQYSTGYMQDLNLLGDFCRKNKLINVINATQSIGAMPINVKESNIDFLVCSTYKWALSGFGVAIIYINKKYLKNFTPPMAGSLNVEGSLSGDFDSLKYTYGAKSLEIGTPHFPNIFALGAAIEIISKLGVNNIQTRIYELQEYLRKELENNEIKTHHFSDKSHRSGILLLDLKNPKEVSDKLEVLNYFVSRRMDGLRLTTHIFNSKDEIDQLVQDLKKIINSL